MSALQIAIISALKNVARVLVASLIAAMPAVIHAFQTGASDSDLITKGVISLIVAGLAAALAFVEKLAVNLAKPSA